LTMAPTHTNKRRKLGRRKAKTTTWRANEKSELH
jgi:hypothetical protein